MYIFKRAALFILIAHLISSQRIYSQNYPFENRNMFFGITQFKSADELPLAVDLGVSWLSMHPLVTWFAMEQTEGTYNFAGLDYSVIQLQSIDLDCTPVLFAANAFGSKRDQLIAKLAGTDFTGFLRSDSSLAWTLFPNDEEGTMDIWLNFIRAVVERYDGDGIDDMPGLKYEIRNWHLQEEYPMIFIDADSYINLLKRTTPIIKETNLNAKVIIPGLAGNYARYFAYADFYIDDTDAGVNNGQVLPRAWYQLNPFWVSEKEAFLKILEEGRDYYDIADLHLYEEKETFIEGKIAWLRNAINSFGVSKPIWCIEGGGPLKITQEQFDAGDTQGDWYFGPYTDKENAGFVVKLHVMAAANGIERDHWGLSATSEGSYWSGPWRNMALATNDLVLKPSYYSFRLMVRMLNNFSQVTDLSTNEYRLYEFSVNNEKCYVAWNRNDSSMNIDLQNYFGSQALVRITHIITDLTQGTIPEEETILPSSVQIGLTPIFVTDVNYPTAIRNNNNPLPSEVKLYQNYPNPFNSSTVITYRISVSSYVQLQVYDLLGEEIVTLVSEEQTAGKYKINFNGIDFPSGIYFYCLTAGDFIQIKKFVLLK